MPQTQNVQIRLDSAVMARYSDIAQAKEMPLAAYLRLILEEGLVGHGEAMAMLLNEMAALRQVLEREAGPADHQAGILLEMLMLLRVKASVQDKDMVSAEVKRQGMRVWTGRDDDEPRRYEPPAPRPAPAAPPAAPAPAKRGLFGRR